MHAKRTDARTINKLLVKLRVPMLHVLDCYRNQNCFLQPKFVPKIGCYLIQKHQLSSEKKLVAILPGSRYQEVTMLLDRMVEVAFDLLIGERGLADGCTGGKKQSQPEKFFIVEIHGGKLSIPVNSLAIELLKHYLFLCPKLQFTLSV